MSVCIYCNENEANSGEHYLPACLGNFLNYEKLYNRLCVGCNEEIGKLDEQFCRCGPATLFRMMLGIKGRRCHKKVDPIYRGSSGGKRVVIETAHPTLDCSIFCEIEKGSGNVYPARQIIVVDSDDSCHPILITEDIKESADLKKEFEKRRLKNPRLVESWASLEERAWIDNLSGYFDFQSPGNRDYSYLTQKQAKITATFGVTDKYFRGIAKIAFHYFLKFFAQFNGNEKQFAGIKEFIKSGGNPDNWVRQIEGSFIAGLNPGATTTDRYCHLIAVEKNERVIRAMLNFFVGPGGVPSHYYEVFIGQNPEGIIYPQVLGHQFVYYDKVGEDGYSGRMDLLVSIRKSLIS